MIWFFSGVLLLVPAQRFGGLTLLRVSQPTAPRYDDIAVTIPAAIASARASLGRDVDVGGIGFLRIDGRLLYQVRVRGASPQLIDAITGDPFRIDEAKAAELLLTAAPRTEWRRVSLLAQHERSYRWGPLPVYRFDIADQHGTSYFVAVENGEVRRSTRLGRWYQMLDGMHTFAFLRPFLEARSVHLLMLAFAATATLMGMFGLAILGVQLTNRWARKRTA